MTYQGPVGPSAPVLTLTPDVVVAIVAHEAKRAGLPVTVTAANLPAATAAARVLLTVIGAHLAPDSESEHS